MISGTHTVEIDTSPEVLWDYLDDFDNWAQFVVGFQQFRRVDERTSVWTLRGDVGVLARVVDLEVTLLEQEAGRRARYSITGITERLDGTGTFEIAPADAPAAPVVVAEPGTPIATEVEPSPQAAPSAGAPVSAPRQGWWGRLVRRLVLAVLRRQHARSARSRAKDAAGTVPSSSVTPSSPPPSPPSSASPPLPPLPSPAPVVAGGSGAVLTFSLEVSAGGPMAPMVEMLMRPLLEPSAEDFSTRVREQLEGTAHVRD